MYAYQLGRLLTPPTEPSPKQSPDTPSSKQPRPRAVTKNKDRKPKVRRHHRQQVEFQQEDPGQGGPYLQDPRTAPQPRIIQEVKTNRTNMG